MTKAEWLTSADPPAMFRYLMDRLGGASLRPVLTDRKARLFACAVTRLALPITNPHSPLTVANIGVAEDYADGFLSADDLAHAADAEALWCCHANAREAAEVATRILDSKQAQTAALLRCIVGNPFRPVKWWRTIGGTKPWSLGWTDARPWLTWNRAAVPEFGRRVYLDRDWAALPVLGDMLEEAGCPQEAVLAHLRGLELCSGCSLPGMEQSGWCAVCGRHSDEISWVPGSDLHARGCWALVLVVGKG